MPTPQEINLLRADLIQHVQLMGQELTLHSTWGLFSPREIDDGTRLLLDFLDTPKPNQTIVDLGCGYGPIGLTLAKAEPTAQVILLDKDFVACDFAAKNAARNHLANVQVKLSNGLSAVQGTPLNRIVSNVPAKVGKELWSIMLLDAWQNLTPGGDIWFVSINGLRDYFKRTFKEQFGNYDKIKQGSEYTIHRAVKE
ncbi:MAG: methyltransferase [Halothiobacillus sp. 20-53-49]|nr:class I SAM-dependent methyltransferase [Halothiobacillaceae bacterium]OYV46690.1 MAG: methyltransferase [Halothiobacillus sp. 20-53-49]HUN00276.1 methyltransferase [Halothiobacillus sp.]